VDNLRHELPFNSVVVENLNFCVYLHIMNPKVIIYILLSIFVSIIVKDDISRHQYDYLDIMELAGSNHSQLKAAMSKFDMRSEEYQALSWVIKNMCWHETGDSSFVREQVKLYQALSEYDVINKSIVDSLSEKYLKRNNRHRKSVKDVEVIDSAFLVSDIEAAFFARRRWPWAASIDIETYIKYVVPYRIADEPLKYGWRHELQSKLVKNLDSIAEITSDPIYATKLILEIPFVKDFTWSGLLPDGARLGPDLVTCRFGNCQNNADRLTYILRSAGIPCGTDKMIFCGNRNNPHSWLFITNGKGVTCYEDCGKFGLSFELELPFIKVHRETYENKQELQVPTNLTRFEVAALNMTTSCEDVTAEYLREPKPLMISLDGIILKEQYWLCLSEHLNWIPVYPARIKANRLCFGVVGNNCLALIAYINEFGYMSFVTNPFVIKRGSPHYISENVTSLSDVVLYRKYSPHIGEFADKMIGGLFEISSDSSFNSDVTTIAKIGKAPNRLWSRLECDSSRASRRYVRYIGADSTHCDVAELKFFDDSLELLTGKVIGTINRVDKEHCIKNVFDDNPYTSFHSDDMSNAWVGLDFGIPKRISYIDYVPRNRDNFIREGDDYELFMWVKTRWQSILQSTATSDSIEAQVPLNGLLYLKNHTRGQDERPFVMSSRNQQVFY